MRAVNLLPSDRRQAESAARSGGAITTSRVAIVGAGVTAAVVGLVGYTFVGARGDVATQRDALASVQQQVATARTEAAALAQAQAQANAATRLPDNVKAQLDAFHMVASQRIRWDVLMGDVSRVVPSGTWLSSLTLQGAAAADAAASTGLATSAAPTGFVASGYALSQNTVARLMQQLARVPMLSDITLQRSEKTNVGVDEAFQFTLSANVRLDGGSR
jgi:Tfp pilus assembly protein PilN